ncbi:hypothetical protein SteCoe_28259 [Stentor coeruleus]|uniref:Uncharacterized protein n=1 Tax=Stentor coeruleus TaxID=5963 RepID=A0A1R2B8V5_9CILI|nr:hypothetical protein SteCoe_28259 [Stentor coeruleus]
MEDIKNIHSALDSYHLSSYDPNRTISSIGKCSIGKTSFLISTFKSKQPKYQKKHANICSSSIKILEYEDFDILDFTFLPPLENDYFSDVFLLSSAFSFSKTILYHITHYDMTQLDYKHKFAYKFYYSSWVCLKFNCKMPDIILVIRDPYFEGQDALTFKLYQNLVEDFIKDVNVMISGFIKNTVNFFDIFHTSQCREYFDQNYFFIGSYYVVYRKNNLVSFMNEYIELEKIDDVWHFEETGFYDLVNRIVLNLNETQQNLGIIDKILNKHMQGEKNELSNELQSLINEDIKAHMKMSLPTRLLNDSKYNIFLKYRKENDYPKIIRYSEMFKNAIKNLDSKLEKKINKILKENKIYKLWEEYQKCINDKFAKNIESFDLISNISLYFQYNMALSFTHIFSLKISNKASLSYMALEILIKAPNCQKAINENIENIYRHINLFRFFINFDDNEFKSILRILMPNNFNMIECISEIFSDIIDYTLKTDYICKDVLLKQRELFDQADNIINIRGFIEIFADYIINEDDKEHKIQLYIGKIQTVIEKLRKLHTFLLIEKNRHLIFCGKNIEIIQLCQTVTITHSEAFYKFAPTASYLFFGLLSTIVPHTIPGINIGLIIIGSFATLLSSFYSLNRKTITKKLTLAYKTNNDQIIDSFIIIRECPFGEIKNTKKIISSKGKKFEYIDLLTVDERSSFLNVVCFLVCVPKGESLMKIKRDLCLEFESKNKEYKLRKNAYNN